jgi:hypothetical protein
VQLLPLQGLAFSPDARHLAWSGYADPGKLNDVFVWDVASRTKRSFRGHRAAVNALAFGAGGRTLALLASRPEGAGIDSGGRCPWLSTPAPSERTKA